MPRSQARQRGAPQAGRADAPGQRKPPGEAASVAARAPARSALARSPSGSRHCHVQFRPETREFSFPELREEYPVASWRNHVELVAYRASVLL